MSGAVQAAGTKVPYTGQLDKQQSCLPYRSEKSQVNALADRCLVRDHFLIDGCPSPPVSQGRRQGGAFSVLVTRALTSFVSAPPS